MNRWASFLAKFLFAFAFLIFFICGAFADSPPSEISADSSDVMVSSGDYQPVGGDALNDLMKSLLDMKTLDAELYGLEGNYEVIEEVSGTLEDGGGNAKVRLAALRREDGVYNRGFVLEIIPVNEEPFIIQLPEDVKGFEASIVLKNFMSREKSEILLTVASGTRGDRFLVIAVAGKHGEVVLDTHTAIIPTVMGRFFDNYRAEIIVPETGERALIDLSPRKAAYDKSRIYNESGLLRRRVAVLIDKLSLFEPVDSDGDGILEIKEIMNLSGAGRSDRIAYVEATLKHGSGGWRVIDSWIAPVEDLNKMPIPIRIN